MRYLFFLMLIAWFAFTLLFTVFESVYKEVLNILPSEFRGAYIEFVLSRDTGFFREQSAKVNLIRIIEKEGYEFDIDILIPLCDRTRNELREPIPQSATNLILNKYPSLIPDLFKYYEEDMKTTDILHLKLNEIDKLD